MEENRDGHVSCVAVATTPQSSRSEECSVTFSFFWFPGICCDDLGCHFRDLLSKAWVCANSLPGSFQEVLVNCVQSKQLEPWHLKKAGFWHTVRFVYIMRGRKHVLPATWPSAQATDRCKYYTWERICKGICTWSHDEAVSFILYVHLISSRKFHNKKNKKYVIYPIFQKLFCNNNNN